MQEPAGSNDNDPSRGMSGLQQYRLLLQLRQEQQGGCAPVLSPEQPGEEFNLGLRELPSPKQEVLSAELHRQQNPRLRLEHAVVLYSMFSEEVRFLMLQGDALPELLETAHLRAPAVLDFDLVFDPDVAQYHVFVPTAYPVQPPEITVTMRSHHFDAETFTDKLAAEIEHEYDRWLKEEENSLVLITQWMQTQQVLHYDESAVFMNPAHPLPPVSTVCYAGAAQRRNRSQAQTSELTEGIFDVTPVAIATGPPTLVPPCIEDDCAILLQQQADIESEMEHWKRQKGKKETQKYLTAFLPPPGQTDSGDGHPGVLWWLATSGSADSSRHPYRSGAVTVEPSSIKSGDIGNVVDYSFSEKSLFFTENKGNSNVVIRLLGGAQCAPLAYRMAHRHGINRFFVRCEP
eukprot:TRINITY_DN7943_c1_g2_i1.p1 TRINITY_DN7943_c1_g2~~TRINITY_DN7943_c1_g2_i1.p1  ORF type:complete len:410 (-),score=66.61 TRINITY_DN7943_c1_g2_i1:849-2057(-)